MERGYSNLTMVFRVISVSVQIILYNTISEVQSTDGVVIVAGDFNKANLKRVFQQSYQQFCELCN